jgi:hypothetical protein
MLTNAHPSARSVFKSPGAWLCTAALTAVLTVWGARPAEGNPPQDVAALQVKAEIEALGVRYASASDAIGRGDVEEGRQLYNSCFTEHALIDVLLTDDPPGTPPNVSVTGPDAYTDFVDAGFSFLGYTSTQHHVGNVQVTVQGNTAVMKSYVMATHFIGSSSVVLAAVTYTDEVVRTPQGWRITHRTLQVTGLTQLSGSALQLP